MMDRTRFDPDVLLKMALLPDDPKPEPGSIPLIQLMAVLFAGGFVFGLYAAHFFHR